MSARDLRRVRGLRSDELRALNPQLDDEVVHRDRLVLVGEEAGEGRADSAPRRSGRRACWPALPRARKDEALVAVADALARRSAEILARERRGRAPGAREPARRRARRPSAARRGPPARRRGQPCATSPRCPTPSGRSSTAGASTTASSCARSACRSASSPSIYEARPNVTVDAAALCLKTGNAVILRGGSAAHAHQPHPRRGRAGRRHRGRPAARGRLVPRRPTAGSSPSCSSSARYVDLVIPRGGEELKDYLLEHSKVPVIYAAGGNCHVYVDAAADLDKALPHHRQRQVPAARACATPPRRCWCIATSPPTFLPRAVEELKRRGVELVVDKAAGDIIGDPALKRANKTHYETEFLALKLAVRVVDSLDEAIEHIATYGTAALRGDRHRGPRPRRGAFTAEVDAACVYVNASTRFTDGGQFGLGAEMGISTQKLHARGPIALQELTCVKYELWGDGQVRALAPWRRARRASACSAAASTRRTSAISSSPPRPAHALGLERVLFVPAAAPPHKGGERAHAGATSGSR